MNNQIKPSCDSFPEDATTIQQKLSEIHVLLRRMVALLMLIFFANAIGVGILLCCFLNLNSRCTSDDSTFSVVSASSSSSDSSNTSNEQIEPSPEELEEQKKQTWIAEQIHSMSNEQKVSQLFIISIEQLTNGIDSIAVGAATQNAMQQYPVGGIIFFENNLQAPEQTKALLSDLQSASLNYSKLPLFLTVDEEGGTVARIANNSAFCIDTSPSMAEIGATGDAEQAHTLGLTIGNYLTALGFNVDFAPVADIVTNSENTVVKQRSFGSTADLVSKMVSAEVSGMKEAGLFATLKHWPGHGNTSGDTHDGITDSGATVETLRNREYLPFQAGIEAGAKFVMVGHFSDYTITNTYTPASLSADLIRPLRDELGFEGIILTDALNMGAILEMTRDSDSVAVAALQAGVDMLLYPQDFISAYQAVLDSLNSDDPDSISTTQIDQALSHILSVKYDLLSQTED